MPSLQWEQRRKGRLGGHAELHRGPVESERPRSMEGRRQLVEESGAGGGALAEGEVWTPSAESTAAALRVAVQHRAEPTLVRGASPGTVQGGVLAAGILKHDLAADDARASLEGSESSQAEAGSGSRQGHPFWGHPNTRQEHKHGSGGRCRGHLLCLFRVASPPPHIFPIWLVVCPSRPCALWIAAGPLFNLALASTTAFQDSD